MKNRTYRVARSVLLLTASAYVLLLCFPQPLFAHVIRSNGFTVYSRVPLDANINSVLERAHGRLIASPLYASHVKPNVFLLNSTRLYASLSLYVGGNSFGKGFAMLPTTNVFVNAHDASKDLVFRDAPANNVRSLSGVLAHETTHLLIRERYGYWRNLTMPTWKKEGYSEYVAGGSTLSYETGVSMWKARPEDATGYQYFKYYMLVKYLLEQEKISVDELFTREFDTDALASTVLKWLSVPNSPAQSVRLFDEGVDCQPNPRSLVTLRICAESRGELRRRRGFE